MLLLPFLPITALIMQNATTLSTLLTYQVHGVHCSPLSDEAAFFQREVERIGAKVDAATLLEKFITNMQRERSEVRRNPRDKTVNLLVVLEGGVEHFHKREANPWAQPVREVFHHRQRPHRHEGDLEEVKHPLVFQWPDMDVTRMDQSETIQMFKSKLRFQIRS